MEYEIPGSATIRVKNAQERRHPFQRDVDRFGNPVMCHKLSNGRWLEVGIGTVFNPSLQHFIARKVDIERRIATSKSMGVTADSKLLKTWELNERYIEAFQANRLKARPYPETLAEAEALPRDHEGNVTFLIVEAE